MNINKVLICFFQLSILGQEIADKKSRIARFIDWAVKSNNSEFSIHPVCKELSSYDEAVLEERLHNRLVRKYNMAMLKKKEDI